MVMRYDRKKAEARFGHLYGQVAGDACHYCDMPSDGHDHQPALHTLHKFAKDRLVTRKQVEERFGPCRLVPCCTICNMGIGAYEGDNDNDRRLEVLGFIDFYDDEGPTKGEWNAGAFMVAFGILQARTENLVGDDIYALPAVGRAIMSHALRTKMGEWPDDAIWKSHRERLALWMSAEPRRKQKHFLDMSGLESYGFRKGVYGRG